MSHRLQCRWREWCRAAGNGKGNETAPRLPATSLLTDWTSSAVGSPSRHTVTLSFPAAMYWLPYMQTIPEHCARQHRKRAYSLRANSTSTVEMSASRIAVAQQKYTHFLLYKGDPL